MHEKEKRIRDERTREATRKGLMGLEGKFGTILRELGEPIISEGGSSWNVNYLPDFYEVPEEETMPVMDMEQALTIKGRFFDGLPRGLHLEIRFMEDEYWVGQRTLGSRSLYVKYEGRTVYAEETNELICYVPNNAWEDKIDMLYAQAKKKEEKKFMQQSKEDRAEAEQMKISLLERIKIFWGV